jgi:hypothetical protein
MEKEPLSHNRKLDETLKVFVDFGKGGLSFDDILRLLTNKFPSLNPNNDFGDELQQILDYLKEDKRIKEEKDRFYLLFRGKVLSENRGYTQEQTNRDAGNIRVAALEHFQKVNACRMTCLTVVIAFGTLVAALYYFAELYWKFHWFH